MSIPVTPEEWARICRRYGSAWAARVFIGGSPFFHKEGAGQMDKPPPPKKPKTPCTACGTKFEKYADLINDPPGDGLRIYYWCVSCDEKGKRDA